MLDNEDHSGVASGIGPFANKSQFRLYDWWYNSSITKSLEDLDCLIDVLLSRGFSLEDLAGFRAHLVQQKLDDYTHPSGVFASEDGWRESSVEIPLPKPTVKHASEEAALTFSVTGIHHRGLTDVVRGVSEDEEFTKEYHWTPHIAFWQVPGTSPPESSRSPTPTPASQSSARSTGPQKPICIYTNTYDSNAAREAHETLQQQARNPDDAPEILYVIFPIMIGSDATHLTSFGAAAQWPIYLYSGALSKYLRGMPSKFTAQHLAYIPSLPDTIQDTYLKAYGTAASADVLTFCKRELMQRIWLLILDDEFMEAYKNGIVVICGNGVTCRIFPRFMTYSADYPEKILVTALKPLARCPCPRCLVAKADIPETVAPDDIEPLAPPRMDSKQQQRNIRKARKLILKDGRSLASKRVKDLLDARSLNPIEPAFSTRLFPLGVNVYDLFAPDLMHEFELGVWKGTFTHLLHLVAAQGDDILKEFNCRSVNHVFLFLSGTRAHASLCIACATCPPLDATKSANFGTMSQCRKTWPHATTRTSWS
ncbi:hypothetical protein C8Q79DRAFT_898265 [Trametes meyenii]|nr:hypothetical protein C8Q79DRAFT_898265 [Trametes meyenii]